MKQSVLLSVGSAAVAAAHGIVSDLNIGGTWYGGYNPYQDKYMNPVPERIVWAFPDAGNGPVEDVSSSDITCNKGATNAPISAAVNAGDDITFYWTEWPESHKGPLMTYMANCGGDCTTADATALSFFKIDHAGLNSDGTTWATDDLIANNGSWTVTVPSDIASGSYLIRHEILALHSAGNANGAQFYPMCANLEVTGSGSADPEGVSFPGAYSADDPGILVSIYNGLTSYTIPGPDVYGGDGSSSSGSTRVTSSAAAVEAATSAIAEVEPATSAAAVGAVPTAVVSEPEVATSAGAVEEPELATSAVAIEPELPTSADVEVPELETSAVADMPIAAPTSVEIPTFTSEAAGLGGFPTFAAPGTTLATVTRSNDAAPTAGTGFGGFGGFGSDAGSSSDSDSGAEAAPTASAGLGGFESDAGSITGPEASSGSSSSVSINQCLDKVNECIAATQSQSGGAVDFSACEAERANCK